jgi:hypothetical protein
MNNQLATNSAPAEGSDGLRDIKPLILLPDYLFWTLVALGIIAAAVVLYFLIKRLRQKNRVAGPPVAPHTRALQRLESALESIASPPLFCTMLSEILREYIDQRFAVHSREQTTEEFTDFLNRSYFLRPDHAEELKELLMNFDLVRFAGLNPAENVLRDLHTRAVNFVEQTQPPPPEQQPQPASEIKS